jgi:hypothetical protein
LHVTNKLLRHYFSLPDKILFIENTSERYTCLEVVIGKIIWRLENSPEWINNFVAPLQSNPTLSVKSLDPKDEVERFAKCRWKKSNRRVQKIKSIKRSTRRRKSGPKEKTRKTPQIMKLCVSF